ncbi:cystathionine beta-synthase [Sphaerobacter thermophilus DSM 20745]|uniref:Cystathionine beta-synthase n=2 Tax=Sphaerobacter TaxID=2056 RepID=D1C5Q2_SPHTD|nr:cystathionine beta-synthase [Sphaerobacter thermophilus DSM 20745]
MRKGGVARSGRTTMIHPNVLSLIGETPLVRLNRVTQGITTPVVAKVEFVNPGGSVKDRIGFRMIEEAERRGWLKPGGTIVEPTSGNTGVGLAMAAAVRGYRCVFVMPDKVSQEKVALLRAYGAEVVTTPTAVPRESPESYYSVADRLTREIPGAFQPNQYFNPINPRAHYETTGPEIWRQTEGKVTHFVAGVGTGGTISGVGRYLKEQNPNIKVIGADPEGSIYTDPDNIRPYKVEGIGEDFWPGTFDRAVVDEFIQVSDRDSFLTARRVTREEGLLVGGSGGTAVWAALQVAARLDDPESLVVVLLPDSGRGYLSKVYNDDWMRENGFLSRFAHGSRVAALLAREADAEIPAVVAATVDQTVEEAIDLLRRYRISQMPVVRAGGTGDGRIEVHSVVGSLQERTLLDQVFRRPEAIREPVSTVMDPPFALVDVKEEVERVFPLLAAGSPAVLVQEEGVLVGIITRADLLDFVAHQKNGG